MKRTTATLVVCCCVALFAACKKNDDDNNSTPAKKQLLAGKWQLSAYTATGNYMGKDTTLDLYGDTEECDKDDFIQFSASGKGTVDEGANKCSDDSQIESFSWMLLNNDTRLYIVDSNPDTMDVVELAGTEMKLKITKMVNSTAVTYMNTYKNIK